MISREHGALPESRTTSSMSLQVDSDNKMTGGSQPTAGLKLHYMDSSKTDQKGHWKKDIFLDNFPNIKCDEEKM